MSIITMAMRIGVVSKLHAKPLQVFSSQVHQALFYYMILIALSQNCTSKPHKVFCEVHQVDGDHRT